MKKLIYFLTFLVFILSSCKDDFLGNESNIKNGDLDIPILKDDYLYFKNQQSFTKVISESKPENIKNIEKWGNTSGFMSLINIYNRGLPEQSEYISKGGVELCDYVNKFRSVFIVNEKNEIVDINGSHSIISCLLNKDGVIKIGNTFIRSDISHKVFRIWHYFNFI